MKRFTVLMLSGSALCMFCNPGSRQVQKTDTSEPLPVTVMEARGTLALTRAFGLRESSRFTGPENLKRRILTCSSGLGNTSGRTPGTWCVRL